MSDRPPDNPQQLGPPRTGQTRRALLINGSAAMLLGPLLASAPLAARKDEIVVVGGWVLKGSDLT